MIERRKIKQTRYVLLLALLTLTALSAIVHATVSLPRVYNFVLGGHKFQLDCPQNPAGHTWTWVDQNCSAAPRTTTTATDLVVEMRDALNDGSRLQPSSPFMVHFDIADVEEVLDVAFRTAQKHAKRGSGRPDGQDPEPIHVKISCFNSAGQPKNWEGDVTGLNSGKKALAWANANCNGKASVEWAIAFSGGGPDSDGGSADSSKALTLERRLMAVAYDEAKQLYRSRMSKEEFAKSFEARIGLCPVGGGVPGQPDHTCPACGGCGPIIGSLYAAFSKGLEVDVYLKGLDGNILAPILKLAATDPNVKKARSAKEWAELTAQTHGTRMPRGGWSRLVLELGAIVVEIPK